jgi:2-polyprenyl-3-methyl-5-hydroxy-6-metoxy-1,4-benzoquinol methylase
MPIETQYDNLFDPDNTDLRHCGQALGVGVAWAYDSDPRHVLFTLARYKFCAKMLSGSRATLEAGCGDGWASRLLLQNVGTLTCTDVDPRFIADAKRRHSAKWPIDFRLHDFVSDGPIQPSIFDSAVSLDVLEHIAPEQQTLFLENISNSLSPRASVIVGSPSLESQVYASPQSRKGHIGCLSQTDLVSACGQIFEKVIAFSMNDEIVHTGFSGMSHYNLALCMKT